MRIDLLRGCYAEVLHGPQGASPEGTVRLVVSDDHGWAAVRLTREQAQSLAISLLTRHTTGQVCLTLTVDDGPAIVVAQ